MGGDIGVTSKEGRGSEFWFTTRFDRQRTKSVDHPDQHGCLDARADRDLTLSEDRRRD